MRADAGLQPVVDRSQVEGVLHLPRAGFGLGELLVAQRHILCRAARVGGGKQILAVELGLGVDGGPVEAQQPAGSHSRVVVQSRP